MPVQFIPDIVAYSFYSLIDTSKFSEYYSIVTLAVFLIL